MAEGVGFEPTVLQCASVWASLTMKMDMRNIIEHLWMLCFLIMRYAKRPSSTGQTVLVLRILDL
jgi:hypothetical protein